MSVTAIPLVSRLQIRLNLGVVDGSPVFRTRSYSNVKSDAENDSVFGVAQAIADLQVHTMENIRRVDEMELVEE